MLKKLFVRNYALIKDLEINFDKGFTVLTGETGAGKSIILGALSLILGKRADTGSLLDKSQKCIVEGIFNIDKAVTGDFFTLNDLDESEPTVIRREITPNGRSRAFINDTPVTLDIMRELGNMLIDIHSQHENLLLGSNQFQLSVIDSFASHDNLIDQYSETYREYRRLEKEYKTLADEKDKNMSDLDYYSYQLKQLDDEKLIEGEETELEKEQELLSHAGDIHDALKNSAPLINGEEHSISSQLNEIKRLLDRIVDFYPEADSMLQRLESSMIELNDLGNEMERDSSGIESDPSRLDYVSQRLDILNSMMQKHRVDDTKSLIEKREEIRGIVSGIETSDIRLSELNDLLEKTMGRMSELATQISENRSQKLTGIENEMNKLLAQLGIPNGRFEVRLSQSDEYTPTGRDHAEFLFSANKQILPENISKVASGGELSRVMLSLKSLLTDNKSLPTIFFDEIDAGVSGEVATKVGEILNSMGNKMQVINITHLPQVAAYGTMHYHVYKEEEKNSTITHIKLLDDKGRLNEVARLLSGNEITKASLDNAREMISEVSAS